jgi:hypothetical protein
MRWPEQRIQEITGITDEKKLSLIEHYMREMYFYPYKLNSVSWEAFEQGVKVSAKELEAIQWDFI